RGFAGAGRAGEGGGLAGAKVGFNFGYTPSFERADDGDWRSRGQRLDIGSGLHGVGAQVRFVQNDDGLRAALPREEKITLDAAEIEIAIESGDDEKHVDV